MLFCIYYNDYMIYILHFVNVVYHIYCFDFEHPRDNSELKKILILLTTPTKEHLKEIIYYI